MSAALRCLLAVALIAAAVSAQTTVVEVTTSKPATTVATTARPSTAVPTTAVPVPTLPPNVTVAFVVELDLNASTLIREIRETVPGAELVKIIALDSEEGPRSSKRVMALLAAINETKTIKLLFVEAPSVANATLMYANTGLLSGVKSASVVEASSNDDDKTKIIIGVCVGAGVLLIVIVLYCLKKGSSESDGSYVAMNNKNSAV